jgi:hypothetical protein
MTKIKEVILLVAIFLLLIQSVSAISNVQHLVDGNKVTLTYQGTPPFLINIRSDTSIGQNGGYLWAKTNSNLFTYDMGFATNPSKTFYYGVKDTSWSGTSSFIIGQENIISNFNAEWFSSEQNPLKFYWNHIPKSEKYYVALDMWTSGNSGPLGSIEMTSQTLKDDYEWSQTTGMDFELPMHVYEYDGDFGELFYGGQFEYPFTFRIKAYLLNQNFDILNLIGEDEIILNSLEDEKCSQDYHPVDKSVLTSHYLNYYNTQYSDWYVCDLDENIRQGFELDCPTGWSGPQLYDLYAYSCYITHKSQIVPNAPNSPSEGCGVNYLHSGIVTTEPIMGGQDYYSSINCQKKGVRSGNSPCETGYAPNILWNVEGHIICGK